jgi:hypothetical protein
VGNRCAVLSGSFAREGECTGTARLDVGLDVDALEWLANPLQRLGKATGSHASRAADMISMSDSSRSDGNIQQTTLFPETSPSGIRWDWDARSARSSLNITSTVTHNWESIVWAARYGVLDI